MRLKTSILPLFLLALFLTPRVSFADTVTLTLDQSAGSPYKFTISGQTVYLTCLNDQRTVNPDPTETWTATVVSLTDLISSSGNNLNATFGGISLGDLEDDAYLDSKYTSNDTSTTNLEVQDAIWSILDNTDVYTGLTNPSNPNKAADEKAVRDLISAAESTTAAGSFDYAGYIYYYPTGSNWNYKNPEPQQFLGYTPPSDAPEPSSLLLLGTGILGAAVLLRRRMVPHKG